MKNKDYFKGKNVLVVGLGRSGYAASCLLSDLGAMVSVTDNSINNSLSEYAGHLKTRGIKVQLGGHTEDFVKGRDLVVLSPGVDNRAQPVIWADVLKIPIISEIELAWFLCPATVIAITGTNGKSTVTTLIGKVLQAGGKKVHICGNIGNPFSGELSKMNEQDYVSLEISSFQLERAQTFKPKISVLLNLSPNHLDRYNNLQEYLAAKKRIFMNQDKNDYAVINYADCALRDLAKEIKAKVMYFNTSLEMNPNFQAVMTVAGILGIDMDTVREVLNNFKGLEHRLEFVAEFRGIEFINDSKATTIDSTLWALNNINKPVILIAGGRNKGLKFDAIKDSIAAKTKRLILIGETKQILREIFKDVVDTQETFSLEEAVRLAYRNAEKGDCILLSPMCASFDMFANFQERGNTFKAAVNNIIKANAQS
jgi:UDP-N-acetylmuramoylalanine--D-glutamate ligase